MLHPGNDNSRLSKARDVISVCVDSKRGYSAYLESVVSSQDGERGQYQDVGHLVDRCQGLVASRWYREDRAE